MQGVQDFMVCPFPAQELRLRNECIAYVLYALLFVTDWVVIYKFCQNLWIHKNHLRQATHCQTSSKPTPALPKLNCLTVEGHTFVRFLFFTQF